MRYREQSNKIESDNQEELMSTFQQEIKEKQAEGWMFMMYRQYTSFQNIGLYGIEYAMSKWE